jgi:hypothetical protein
MGGTKCFPITANYENKKAEQFKPRILTPWLLTREDKYAGVNETPSWAARPRVAS